MMETRVVLGSDDNFKRAKEALVWLYEHRSETDLHEIYIHEYKSTRSTRANSFYWSAVVTAAADVIGYSPEELHGVICCALYGVRRVRIGTFEFERPNRTTTWPKKMNTEEFNLHIERACSLLAEQGISIDQSGWTK